jgi:hypothetical protein
VRKKDREEYPWISLDMMDLSNLQTPAMFPNIINRQIPRFRASYEIGILDWHAGCISVMRNFWRKRDALGPFY